MKKIFLAALTVLSLGAGVANAQSLSHSTVAGDRAATLMQQTGSYGGE